MATAAERLANNLNFGAIGKATELRNRLLFTLGALIVFRLGTFLPIPGINPIALQQFFEQQSSGILGIFDTFSGGALGRMGIFALGVMPYISASIIMQLLSATVPSLEQLKKEGDSGRRTINRYTRYGTVLLATIQGSAMAVGFGSQGLAYEVTPMFYAVAISSLVAGAVFLMWLGEQITERGIGNGISMLIFAGIVAGMPGAAGQALESARQGDLNPLMLLFVLIIGVAVVYFVVFIERGQRRLTVNYAQRQGRQAYNAQTSHLPLKVNMAGVIPAIFASSLLLFPTSISTWFGQGVNAPEWLQDVALLIGPGQPLYILLFSSLIIFFSFFYTALMYNPREVADNLKKGGAFLPGIRPGENTAKYIDSVTTRLTLIGGVYITLICLMPQFLNVYFNVPFYLGGTSLLIAVVVTMDFMAQVQSHIQSKQYDSLMKKANLKNVGRR